MRFQHPGCDVHYELEGPADGLPVLMIHGFGCQLEIMRGCMEPAMAAAKANERLLRVYVDLPGHGRSAKADLTLASSDALAACLLALMDHVAPGRPFAVAGQSFGGYLALGLATQHPDKVIGLQLLCPLTTPDLEGRSVEKLELIRHDDAFLASLADADRESFLQLAVRADRQTWQRFAAEEAPGFAVANPAFMDAVDEHLPLSPSVDDALAEQPFEKPTLILCGRQDAMVGYRDQLRLIPLMPRCTFAILDISGHNLQFEQPALFTTLTADWIGRLLEESH